MQVQQVDGSLVDALHLFLKDEKMMEFVTLQGNIVFYKDEHVENDAIYIYSIVIDDSLRRKGIFKSFLEYIIEKCPEKRVVGVLAVGSPILDEFLSRFCPLNRHFANHGGDYLWSRVGQVCSNSCHDYIPSTGKLIPIVY